MKKKSNNNNVPPEFAGNHSDIYETILNSVSEAILLLSKDFNIVWANQAALARSGFTLNEVIGKKCYEVTHFRQDPCDPAKDLCPINQSDGDTGQTVEHIHADKNGNKRVVEVSSYPIRNMGGEVIRWVHISRDITERKLGEEKLRALTNHLIEVQEKERRSIARDLHDEIGQGLVVLKMLWAQGKESLKMTKEIQSKAEDTINELTTKVRQLALDLRPTVLDDLGLLAALLWLFKQYHSRTAIDVQFKHEGLDKKLSSHIALTTYRVIQEALTNVAHFAEVTTVAVSVRIRGGTLSLCVKDQGKGFDINVVRHIASIGLSGMRERVEAAGGSFTLESMHGKGTRIKAVIPLSNSG